MTPDSTMLIIENILPQGNKASETKFIDLNMLAMCRGGRERTLEEFRSLIIRAGLKLMSSEGTNDLPDLHILEVCKG